MNDACVASPETYGFVSSMTKFIDCQAQALGSSSWQALATPGSSLFVLLTGFLTIAIALIGYNLLLGAHFTIRSATLTFVKVAAVLTLTTSWPAYRTLVYDVIIDGPTQIAGETGRAAALPGSDGTLTRRLDLADEALNDLAITGAGTIVIPQNDVAPPPFAGFNAFALGGSRILFLLTAIGGLGIVRIVSGLMLALGPFFIAFLMFDNTRSLFEGWLRVLAGSALGAAGAAITLGLQLRLMEPWLADVLVRRAAGEVLPAVPAELVVITLIFALAMLAVLAASARVARAFRFALLLPDRNEHETARSNLDHAPARTILRPVAEERSRAAAVADIALALHRRDVFTHSVTSAAVGAAGAPRPLGLQPDRNAPSGRVPVGRSFRRTTRARVSASAGRRDAN